MLSLAAVNAIFITWATVLDNRHPSALARALGATPREVSSALAAAQVLPALAGAALGVFPGSIALLAVINAVNDNDSNATLPPLWQLLALVAGTVLVVAALTAVPPRLGGRRPVTQTLQAELTPSCIGAGAVGGVSAAGPVGAVNPTGASGRVTVSMEHPVTAATRGDGLAWRSTEGHRAEGRQAEGLESEFVAFARRRGPHHLRTAVLLTGDWHTAEDLVQTCLAKLYRVWHRLDTGVDPDSYLRRMLVNTQRSWWRARWRREAPVEVVPDHAIEGDGQERQALADTVRRALAALPARQRAVLVLRYFEDLPEAQVADLLGCSVGTVKTHTSRGIRRLRELLGDELVPTDPGTGHVNDLAGQRRDSG